MVSRRWPIAVLIPIACTTLLLSCSKKEKATEEKTEEKPISYVSQDVSFGLFFNEEGTERTITLKKDQKEFTGYLYLQFPEIMQIASVEWRLVLPEGVEIEIDKYNTDRVMSLGFIENGISETFQPCASGPKFLLHTFVFRTTKTLKNAEFSLMASNDGNFLGVAECKEGFPRTRAAAYKAVVNPEN